MRRVVVTGLGAVTPCGVSFDQTWDAVVRGQSGIKRVTSCAVDDLRCQFAGECSDFDPSRFMDAKTVRHNGRFIQFALAAAEMALSAAGRPDQALDPRRLATIIGVGMASLHDIVDSQHTLDQKGAKRVTPFFIPRSLSNLAAGQVAMRFGAQGPSFCPTSACTSGAHAVAQAMDQIRLNRADVVIAGGAEAGVNRLALAGFDAMRALSVRNDAPHEASRPFDRDRDGFVLSEGAAVLILEERERAIARGAPILAEVLGHGSTTDAYHVSHPPPEGRGLADAMRLALADARVNAEDVGYVNAHATSTPAGDEAEAQAVLSVFGGKNSLWVSSTKSTTGHLLGAAGALEAAITVQVIAKGVVPPTINLKRVDQAFEGLLDFVPHEARRRQIRIAASNSTGFGGHNASLIFGAA